MYLLAHEIVKASVKAAWGSGFHEEYLGSCALILEAKRSVEKSKHISCSL